MTVTDMHINFKLELDKTDSLNYPDFESEEIDKWLNIAQERYVKQRYGGMNMRRESFEQTQKRIDDLRVLVTNAEITPSAAVAANKPNAVFATLPTSASAYYWLAVQEEAQVVYMECSSSTVKTGSIASGSYYFVSSGTVTYNGTAYSAGQYFLGVGGQINFTGSGTVNTANVKRVRIKPIKHDEYNELIRDPFNKPYEDEVLRLSYQGDVELITDGTFAVSKYFLRYIRKPKEILLDLLVPGNNVDCELADHTHQEIVEQAVLLALESIESQRYQTHSLETAKQE